MITLLIIMFVRVIQPADNQMPKMQPMKFKAYFPVGLPNVRKIISDMGVDKKKKKSLL